MSVLVVVLAAVLGGLLGLTVPELIRRLPEPAPRKRPAESSGPPELAESDAPAESTRTPEPPKIPYAELADRSRLRPASAVAGAVVGALLGLSVETWWLWILVVLLPVFVALAYVDWHTQLLPTRLVLPATGAVLVAGLVGWAVSGDPDPLVRGLIGLVIARSVYWVLWFIHSAGMGFGDVRLAALLGFSLGELGWGELVVGTYAGFLIFGLPGLLLAIIRRDRALLRSAFPFGPFMLVGALLGVLVGPWTWAHLVSG